MPTPQTPYFQYHPDAVEAGVQVFDAFTRSGIRVLYALKSNTYEPLVKRLIAAGYGFDVASAHEIRLVHRLGCDLSNVSFSAPSKLEEELREASELGIPYYAFDSEQELEKIMRCVRQPSLIARIAVQDRGDGQNLSEIFGMSPEYYLRLLRKIIAKGYPIPGLTFHVGSQNTSITAWQHALDQMTSVAARARSLGAIIPFLNAGGGIPAPYTAGVKPTKFYVDRVCAMLQDFARRTGITHLFIEPGRGVSASSMSLLTRVVNIKTHKRPPILVTDMSIFNGLLERLEHVEFSVEFCGLERASGERRKAFKVTGMSCDGYDVISERCLLPADVGIGDLLRIPNAGAYTFVYERFHMRPYPPVVHLEPLKG